MEGVREAIACPWKVKKIYLQKNLYKLACNQQIAGNENSASMRRKAVMQRAQYENWKKRVRREFKKLAGETKKVEGLGWSQYLDKRVKEIGFRSINHLCAELSQ
ncbi:hypothetical protein [Apis mellifera associated microvirus 23]|nr:hypothetical protein [Apis mellifera associated microvirus 23]